MKTKQPKPEKYESLEGMPDELFPYDRNFGCQLFQVQIPKKALIKLKTKYKNVGAAIRGMIAQDLGPDWPADEVHILNGVTQKKGPRLAVILRTNPDQKSKRSRKKVA